MAGKDANRWTIHNALRRAIEEGHQRTLDLHETINYLIAFTDLAHPGFSALLKRLREEALQRETYLIPAPDDPAKRGGSST